MKQIYFLSLVVFLFSACKKSDGGQGTIEPPAPTLAISDFSPKSAQPATKITITGTGFGNDPSAVQVAIGTSPYDHPISVTPTSIVVQTNLSTPSGKISVIINGNKVFSTTDFTALLEDLKFVGFSGDNRLGRLFTISGQGFGSDISKISVSFGGTAPVPITYLSASNLTIQTNIPRYAKEGKVTVTVGSNSFTGDSILRFRCSMADFTPKRFSKGDTVKISGFGFTNINDMSIDFNNNAVARPIKVTPNQIIVIAPASANSGYLGISAALGTLTDTSPDKYIFIP